MNALSLSPMICVRRTRLSASTGSHDIFLTVLHILQPTRNSPLTNYVAYI